MSSVPLLKADIPKILHYICCPPCESRVCVCEWEREYVCVWDRERVCVCVSERERICVCVWEWQRERICVCVRERERVCVCVCVSEREREGVCVCVCVCRASVIFDKWRLCNVQNSGTSSSPTLKSHLFPFPRLETSLQRFLLCLQMPSDCILWLHIAVLE